MDQNALRSTVCFGAAAGAAILGATLSPATGAPLLVAATGALLTNIGANLAYDGGKGGMAALGARLRTAKLGDLPINGDIARGLREAQLRALEHSIALYRAGGDGRRPLARLVGDWIAFARRQTHEPDFAKAELDGVLAALPADSVHGDDLRRAAEAAMLLDLGAYTAMRGHALPEDFNEVVREGDAHGAPWFEAARAHFHQMLKDPGADVLRAAYQIDQFERLETSLQRLVQAQSAGLKAIVDRLDKSMPAGTTWLLAAQQVERRRLDLLGPLHGRDDWLRRLDAFIENHSSGLLILTGDAGTGKSALLAHWTEERRALDFVAQHFISQSYDATIDPAAVQAILSVQVARALGETGAGLLESPSALASLTAEKIGYWNLAQGRLIIVIDSLDEAQSAVIPFFEGPLPDGVFVVVSCRARDGEWPSPVERWRRQMSYQQAGERWQLDGISIAATAEWMGRMDTGLAPARSLALAAQLHKSMDGLPLFIGEVLASPPVRIDEGSLPASFADYVEARLAELERADQIWSRGARRLFATLCAVKGSISLGELEDLLGEACPNLVNLDPRISRWFTIGGEGIKRAFSFHHPRLADAFAGSLGDEVATATDALVGWASNAWRPRTSRGREVHGSAYALDWLVAHLMDTGDVGTVQARDLLSDPDFVRARLMDHVHARRRLTLNCDEWSRLPAELKAGDRARHWTTFWAENETRCRAAWRHHAVDGRPYADVVSDCMGDAFIETGGGGRLKALAHNPQPAQPGLLIRTLAAHHEAILGVRLIGDHLVSWGQDGMIRFWTLAGQDAGGPGKVHGGWVSGVERIAGHVVSWGQDGAIRFWTLAGEDAGGPGKVHGGWVSGVKRIADHVVSWGQDGVIRSWTLAGEDAGGPGKAHDGGVWGVELIGDHIVSWGQDGAIRFWTLDGEDAGGPGKVHDGGVWGVSQVGDHIVSWGWDGAIRFWTLGGMGDGGPGKVHDNLITGVELIGDHIVSWGQDGTIRFWTLAGEDAGGPGKVHGRWISGVKRIADHVVSWGQDGAIRFWTLAGANAGGPGKVHDGGVWGVELIGDHIVSWGRDGAIRFWTLDGEDAGGPVKDQSGRISGVEQFGGHIVSWGDDGMIRFWAFPNAASDPGRLAKVHNGDVCGVERIGDHIVSWGDDGMIRFWTLEGADAGGPGKVHDGGVSGVQQIGDRVVSWGWDGAIRFWTLAGENAGGPGQAHDGGVWGVERIGDRIVSWGNGGVIRTWTLAGEDAGGPVKAHDGGVSGVELVGDHIVSWGRDGAIRFWTRSGEDAGGLGRVHDGPVQGLKRIGDNIVSWGRDGAIRFWSLAGEEADGPGKAHDGGVWGVELVGDRIVSWGQDGAIRFWTLSGEDAGGLGRVHDGPVQGLKWIGDNVVSWGRDGAIRFSTLVGEDAGGSGPSNDNAAQGVERIGDHVFSWDSDGTIRFWTLSGEDAGTLVPPGGIDHVTHLPEVGLLCFGRRLWVYRVRGNGLPWN